MALTTLVLLSALSGHLASAVPRPKTVQMRGKLGKSRAVLVADDGDEYTMHGIDSETGEELTRLSGVKIEAFGLLNDPRFPRGYHVLVQRNRIADVYKGVFPRTGVIASVEMGETKRLLFVDDQSRADLLPQEWGKKMNRHLGARIWMVGSGKGASTKPLRFSILRGARK